MGMRMMNRQVLTHVLEQPVSMILLNSWYLGCNIILLKKQNFKNYWAKKLKIGELNWNKIVSEKFTFHKGLFAIITCKNNPEFS